MSTHDSVTRYGQGRTWRTRLRLAWRSLRAVVPWRRGSAGPVRAGRRERRRLSSIEWALAAEAPQLASMFEMFAQLAVGESHDGAERLPRSARRGPRRAQVALLLAFASLVALCVTLSFRVHPGSRSCLASAPSTSAASPGSSSSPGFRAAGAVAYLPARVPGCPAYPTYSK
jgi:hypothetical protein